MMSLTELGWCDGFARQAPELSVAEQPARVIAVDRDRYLLKSEAGELAATLMGKFRHAAESPLDFPCVGDWVVVQPAEGDGVAAIHALYPRRTFLRRKMAGRNVEFQLIGANIDVALIVQSCHFDFNLRRLERYLVMVYEGGVEPLILLTKVDLISAEELEERLDSIQQMGIGAPVIALSSVSGVGIDRLREVMQAGRTYSLVGSSGVGKSTLINQLLGHVELETKTVSASGEGRHTTVRRQLIQLDQGAMLIDTPGMRELAVVAAEEGLDDGYADIVALAEQCRFHDCSHNNEPGCAIQAALEDGRLDEAHYHNYLKIKRESEFYQSSYLEKRKKDRAFGKMVNAVKRDKARWRG